MKDTMTEAMREEEMATMVHYATIGMTVLSFNELGYQTTVTSADDDGCDAMYRDAVDIQVRTPILTVVFTVKTSIKYNTVMFGNYRVVFDDIAQCNDEWAMTLIHTVGDVVKSIIEELATNSTLVFG